MAIAKERSIITDKLVIEKTGKPMEHWFLMLDKKGATAIKPSEIFQLAANIKQLQLLGEWNLNLLITTYCWSRGIKKRGEKENGYEISVSKTINVAVKDLYESWVVDTKRNDWLGKEKIIFRKTTANKSARITWSDQVTSLSIDFYEKGLQKSQVLVQHQKIADDKTAASLKDYWGIKLEQLKKWLEK